MYVCMSVCILQKSRKKCLKRKGSLHAQPTFPIQSQVVLLGTYIYLLFKLRQHLKDPQPDT